MNKIKNLNTNIKLILLFSTILILIFGTYDLFGYYFGYSDGDFYSQHLIFLDYLRMNFKQTHELFPQFAMNFGLGQSMTTLYYHGLYNPLLLIYYIVPNVIPTIFVYQIILIILNTTSSLGMYNLLKQNNISNKLSKIGAYLFLTTGVLYTQYWANPMYIYYMPFFIWSLWSIDYFIKTKKIYPFILFFTTIFYMNFFFVPYVSVILFIYLITKLYVSKKKKKVKTKLKYVSKFLVGYFIAVILSLFYLSPVYLLFKESSRNNFSIDIKDLLAINFDFLTTLSMDGFFSGIALLAIIAIYFTFKNKKTSKNYLWLAIFLLFTVTFSGYVYAMNLFQYTNFKLVIYNIPLYFVLLFIQVQNGGIKFNKKDFTLFLLISIILLKQQGVNGYNELYKHTGVIAVDILIIVFIVSCVTIFIINKNKNQKLIYSMCTLLLITNIFYYGTFINTKTAQSIVPTNKAKENYATLNPDKNSLYRTYTGETNRSLAMNSYNPEFFASLINKNYQNFFKEYNVTNEFHGDRAMSKAVFDNQNIRKYLGIKYYCNLENQCTNLEEEVNPIVYGVQSKDVYSITEINNLTSNQRTLALNQGLFINQKINKKFEPQTNDKTFKKNYYELINLKSSSREENITIPKEMMGNQLIISFDVVNSNQIRNFDNSNSLEINDIPNSLEGDTAAKGHFKYVLDLSKDINQIKIKIPSKTIWILKNIEITYSTREKLNENNVEITQPQNVEVDYNNGIKFNIEMNPGIIATTIPLDPGFDIYIDQEKTNILEINGAFLGAYYPGGKHTVEIKYHIPGFKIGAIITTLGIVLVFAVIVWEIKNDKVSV